MSKTIYFISDAHFGAGTPEKEQEKLNRFSAFIESLKGSDSYLYIMGDLFDFWFEYGSAVFKKHFSVLKLLKDLTDSGVGATYIAGNHDFSLGPFLTDQIGLTVSADPVTAEHQGKKLFIAHGDGLIDKDRGYKVLKWFLRLKINNFLFRLIHPDIGAWLADRTSSTSRTHFSKEKKFDFREQYRAMARRHFAEGYDAVLTGHSHFPAIEETDGKTIADTGNWIDDFSYVKLEDGKFTLETWSG